MAGDLEPCVVRDMIDRLAAERPEQTALIFADGPQWSFAELREKVRQHAAGLQRLGVRQDAFVLSWQPNGPDAALTFLALNYLGAVYVPINIAYRGGVLQHVIENSGATLMIAHSALAERLATVGRGALERVAVTGALAAAPGGLELIGPEALSGPAETVSAPERPLRPWDTHMVIYTSGTTGPSKGVLSSYCHSYTAAREFRNIGPGDRNLTALPMHHVGGVYGLLWAMIHGGSVVIADAFRTGEFWSIVRRYDVTTTGLLGAMTRFLLAQPPSPDDRRHTLKSVVIAPYDEAAVTFSERFGVNVYTEFNMTELSVPLFAGPGPLRPGSCGKARPGVELRLVDEHDIEAAEGASGELVLRTDTPWTISHGYHNDPAATAAAWRNGWFHTGDLFRRDADGNYYFLDRTKDALRRRGENISSFEVESAIMLHPAVGEAAVVAARGADAEDEVMAVIVLKEGVELEQAELFSFLRTRLAHFMLPRYLRFVPDLPRTPTHKVEKHRLRAEGVTSDTWDREAAGITIRRERLESR